MKINFKAAGILKYLSLACLFISLNQFEVYAAEYVGIITGSPIGTYAEIAADLGDACGDLEIKIFQSKGSMQNIEKLLDPDEDLHFGIVQLDALQYLKETNSELQLENIVMAIPLFTEEIHLAAKPDSPIKNLADLAGKRVNVGPRTSGTKVTADMIRKATGIEWEEFNLDFEEAIQSLIENEIDAFFYVIGMPVPYFTQLSNEIKLVSIKNGALNKIYIPAVIPRKTYPWQKTKINTYKVPSLLITNINVPEIKIKALLNCIKNKKALLKKQKHKKWKELNIKNYKQIKWPVHPVAKRVIDKSK